MKTEMEVCVLEPNAPSDRERPGRFALLLVRLTGGVFLLLGCVWLALLNPLGILVALVGRHLLLYPTDLRSPWVDAVVELVRQWRGSG